MNREWTVDGEGLENSEINDNGLSFSPTTRRRTLKLVAGVGGVTSGIPLVGRATTKSNVITECETVIDQSGNYTLGADLTCDGDFAVKITADDVTLDGQGHSIEITELASGGVLARSVTNVTVTNIEISGVQHNGVYFESVSDGEVNNITPHSGRTKVSLQNCTRCTAAENHAPHSASFGRNNKIVNNVSKNYSYGSGIILFQEDNTLVEGNFVAQKRNGILLDGSNRNRILSNTVKNNKDRGILLFGNAHQNLVSGNVLCGNDIAIQDLDDNIVRGNQTC